MDNYYQNNIHLLFRPLAIDFLIKYFQVISARPIGGFEAKKTQVWLLLGNRVKRQILHVKSQ
jgi:hypothetical protein